MKIINPNNESVRGVEVGRWRFIKVFKMFPVCFDCHKGALDLYKDICYILCIENMCDHELGVHGICIKLLLKYGYVNPEFMEFKVFKGQFDFIHSDVQTTYKFY